MGRLVSDRIAVLDFLAYVLTEVAYRSHVGLRRVRLLREWILDGPSRTALRGDPEEVPQMDLASSHDFFTDGFENAVHGLRADLVVELEFLRDRAGDVLRVDHRVKSNGIIRMVSREGFEPSNRRMDLQSTAFDRLATDSSCVRGDRRAMAGETRVVRGTQYPRWFGGIARLQRSPEEEWFLIVFTATSELSSFHKRCRQLSSCGEVRLLLRKYHAFVRPHYDLFEFCNRRGKFAGMRNIRFQHIAELLRFSANRLNLTDGYFGRRDVFERVKFSHMWKLLVWSDFGL